MSFGQAFEKQERFSHYIAYEVGEDSLFTERDRRIDIPFVVDYNMVSANFSFLSKGDFKDRIILDNYNNYFHHMLFNKQLFASIAFRYNEFYKNSNWDHKGVSTNFNCAYGLLNRFEFFYNFEYVWETSGYNDRKRYEADLENKFGIKYRSYEYSVEDPSKWYTDDKIDVILGSIPKFAEVYTEFTFEPPRYYHNKIYKIGLFNLKKMRSDESDNISLFLILGLGRNIVLNFNCSEYYAEGELQKRCL